MINKVYKTNNIPWQQCFNVFRQIKRPTLTPSIIKKKTKCLILLLSGIDIDFKRGFLMADNKTHFVLISIVAIVAVVGIVSMIVTTQRGASLQTSDSENKAGQAIYRPPVETLDEGGWCGDGMLDTSSNEQCDGTDFGMKLLCSLYSSSYSSGTLKCTSSCQIDTSGCVEVPKFSDSAQLVVNGITTNTIPKSSNAKLELTTSPSPTLPLTFNYYYAASEPVAYTYILIGTSSAPPYTIYWNVGNKTPGGHKLLIEAVSTDGTKQYYQPSRSPSLQHYYIWIN